MKLLLFLRNRITAALGTLLLGAVLFALFIGYRLAIGIQTDDRDRLAAKRDYLERISRDHAAGPDAPNIVFFLFDDLGYGDIGHGAVDSAMIATPHIDALAAAGVTLTQFYSPSPVCTPSRAGFLTGRLAPRAGLPDVLFPSGTIGATLSRALSGTSGNSRLPAEEITLAELLGAAGYATGMVGKWHLGDRSPSLPNDMGFDSYFGALYSNDMRPFALYADRDIAMEAPVDQRFLTEYYTQAALAFIERQEDQPFFLYYAHNFPHDPLFVREERSGLSRAGLFGDVMEEIDDGIGAIVAALARGGLLENTLIIISSDNGPWFLGDAGNLRGRKGNTFEGGMRVPFIAHWPRGIEPGRVEHAMAMGTDLLPTLLELLHLPPPRDRLLDGRSILAVLAAGAPTPHDYLYYYAGETLVAVRDQRFKYRGPSGVAYHPDQLPLGVRMSVKEWLLDLAGDPRESYDTSDHNPHELARLRAAFEARNREMAANPRGWR